MTKRTSNPLLHLLSWLYGLGVDLRNTLFDQGILRQKKYPIPLICVGNITVGGTGKTPHIELLLSLLSPTLRVAVISRGYKRQSHGLQIASPTSTVQQVGDEPRQLALKYPHVQIIVDGNRRRAMKFLLSQPAEHRPEVVLLDDGFQHRYVQPSFSILLVDASRELHEDTLLPMGSLREPASARYRADCIILTKCPIDLQPIDLRIMRRNLALYTHQRIFFSRIVYQEARPLHALRSPGSEILPCGAPIVAVAGIASPTVFFEDLKRYYKVMATISFHDHHNFRSSDLQQIRSIWEREQAIAGIAQPVSIVCTEKDAVRLIDLGAKLDEELAKRIFYLPIKTEILFKPEDFRKMILQAAKTLPSSLQHRS